MALNKNNSTSQFLKRPPLGFRADTNTEATWVPNTDVYIGENGLVIKVELAGMHREDLELTMDANCLRISGQRPDDRTPNSKFILMEINYGPFESVIELPKGYDLGHAIAAYHNGMLRIDVPPLIRNTQKRTKDKAESKESKDSSPDPES